MTVRKIFWLVRRESVDQLDTFVCRGRIGLIHCQTMAKASCCCITNSASICDVTALNYWIEPCVNVPRFRVRRNYIFHVRITVFHHALESLHFAIRCLNTMADIFANNTLHFIFLRWVLIPISLEVTLVGPFDSRSTLVQVVAWQEIVAKSSPVLVTQFIRCVKGHQRVKCAQTHDDVIKWKHFPCYWPFVRGIHRLPVNSQHKGQWHGALMVSLICVWINGWVNNREDGDLRRHCGHYDVTVMLISVVIFSSRRSVNINRISHSWMEMVYLKIHLTRRGTVTFISVSEISHRIMAYRLLGTKPLSAQMPLDAKEQTFSEILIKIRTFSFIKMSPAKWWSCIVCTKMAYFWRTVHYWLHW